MLCLFNSNEITLIEQKKQVWLGRHDTIYSSANIDPTKRNLQGKNSQIFISVLYITK
jgi:hypothetical protein